MWRKQWHPTPVLVPGKSHGRRSLVGCSPWGRWESDMTERLHFHFSLSCLGEGNGNHSSVLAWRIPGTGEPGGLLSMGSHRVGHDWSDLAAAAEKNMSHFYFYPLSHFSSAAHLPPPSTRTTCGMIKNEYCLIFFVALKFTHREKPTILRKPSG